MSALRPSGARRSSIEALYRLRAVESPPDGTGQRKVWHRGAPHTELVSYLDAEGTVTRHEFWLFDDVVFWERERGFTTGRGLAVGNAAEVEFDLAADPTRFLRVLSAVQPYGGRDRILTHFGQQLIQQHEPATDTHQALDGSESPSAQLLSLTNWVLIVLIALAIALGWVFLKETS